uniref:Uncharacterized protein n=1 Tax=Rhizophora mucronata TaxID=61149 RepID=A0A2P2K648_RHIMU
MYPVQVPLGRGSVSTVSEMAKSEAAEPSSLETSLAQLIFEHQQSTLRLRDQTGQFFFFVCFPLAIWSLCLGLF